MIRRLRDLGRRLQPRSLRTRFAVLAVLIAGVAVALLGTAFVAVLSNRLDSSSRDLLKTRVQAAGGLVTVDANGQVQVSETLADQVLDEGTWIFRGTTALSRSSGPADIQTAVLDRVGTTGFTEGPGNTLLYALGIPEDTAPTGTVVGVLSRESESDAVDTVEALVVGLGLLLMLGTFFATRVIVGRALEPVAELTHQAGDWSATDVTRRFGRGRRPTELADLAATLDGVLDRLSAVLRHEQRLSGELSHELRTPLARIVAEIDLLQARPRSHAELNAAHTTIGASAARMDDILQTLLSTARGGADVPPGRSEVLERLGTLVTSYDDPRLTLAGSPATSGVDGAVVDRIVTPIIDNALRYAREQVMVTVAAGPVIEIRDDGPGIAPDLRDAAFDPGRRLQPEDGHHGAGLGLSLSLRLARASGGDIELLDPSGGAGLVVRVSLPGG